MERGKEGRGELEGGKKVRTQGMPASLKYCVWVLKSFGLHDELLLSGGSCKWKFRIHTRLEKEFEMESVSLLERCLSRASGTYPVRPYSSINIYLSFVAPLRYDGLQ